jgi:hypothetical protein
MCKGQKTDCKHNKSVMCKLYKKDMKLHTMLFIACLPLLQTTTVKPMMRHAFKILGIQCMQEGSQNGSCHKLSSISGSHVSENEDDSFLGCSAV